ncbi:glycosyltransferase [Dysgonomonas sp. 511]|uniref:glycosyltransferase n=1 Tax=Dysgonomonas sp. 511 TaxID=2302930 RepID=UPI0013D1F992|nr:glycosyltransferase [Dysgonomonas sp. 511]NDV78857.1 glycosyltransferase [Dysgonomonas sp. 511]
MKKIIIISHNLRIGGVERSLIGLLNGFDYTKYEIDLFLFVHDGELMNLIPKGVSLIPQNNRYASMLLPFKKVLKKGYFDILFNKFKAHFFAKRYCTQNKLKPENLVYPTYLQKYLLGSLPTISNKEYDLAISFLTPHYIAANKVKSKKKIAWIHTDYSFFDFDKKTEFSMWNQYNYIASISDSSTNSFVGQFPSLANKIVLIENILSPIFIRDQSLKENICNEVISVKDGYTICSVGRFCDAKNFDNIPFICKYLIQKGHNVRWYLIGYGGDEKLIRAKIEETQMQNNVIILGKKTNPYPYIKACDIYVQPSRYEGKAVTVREAQILCKPVVITNFATSSSQLQDGFDGIIVPLDNESCAEGISYLLQNSDLQKKLINNCKLTDYSNSDEVRKIYSLID